MLNSMIIDLTHETFTKCDNGHDFIKDFLVFTSFFKHYHLHFRETHPSFAT